MTAQPGLAGSGGGSFESTLIQMTAQGDLGKGVRTVPVGEEAAGVRVVAVGEPFREHIPVRQRVGWGTAVLRPPAARAVHTDRLFELGRLSDQGARRRSSSRRRRRRQREHRDTKTQRESRQRKRGRVLERTSTGAWCAGCGRSHPCRPAACGTSPCHLPSSRTQSDPPPAKKAAFEGRLWSGDAQRTQVPAGP